MFDGRVSGECMENVLQGGAGEETFVVLCSLGVSPAFQAAHIPN